MFYGTKGYLEVSGGTWKAFRGKEEEPFAGSGNVAQTQPDLTSTVSTGSAPSHWGNFVDAIRSGSRETLNCDIIDGFYSSSLPLLANISCRLGRGLNFIGDYEQFAGDSEANTMLTRRYRKPYIVPDEV